MRRWLLAAAVVLVSATVASSQIPIGSVLLQDPTTATQQATVTAANALKVDGSAVTQPVSGTVSIAANQSVNVNQFGGNAVATGTGAGGVGIPRVTVSSDSSLAANQSVNTAQFGGTAISTGTGAGGLGIPRVTISNDSALAANQSTNVAQINGVTPLMGNGVTGTGSPRVTLSSDTSAIANWGQGATGSAVPSGGHYVAGNGSGNLTGETVCDNWTPINQTGNTQIITGAAAKKTYICAINLVTATAQNIALVAGTGTVCATGIAGLAGGTTAATGWNFAANGGLTQGTGVGAIIRGATNADNVCILQSGAGQVSGAIAWTQY